MADLPTDANESNPDEIERALRQLALVDRIIGLEAQLARLASTPVEPEPPVEPTEEFLENQRLHRELHALYESRPWKLGTAMLRPARAVKRLGRRGSA